MKAGQRNAQSPAIDLESWKAVKEAIRNFTFENFNPGLLPDDHWLRRNIFDKISSTSGLFLALEPQVFVSKIRARVFRTWKAAEEYYANSLREARNAFLHADLDVEPDDEEPQQIMSPKNVTELTQRN